MQPTDNMTIGANAKIVQIVFSISSILRVVTSHSTVPQ